MIVAVTKNIQICTSHVSQSQRMLFYIVKKVKKLEWWLGLVVKVPGGSFIARPSFHFFDIAKTANPTHI